MAETKPATSRMTAEKVERVNDVLQGLKDDARKAIEDGDLFLASVYKQLLRVTSPIVVRATARLEREEKAQINKDEKALRQTEREKAEQAAKAQRKPERKKSEQAPIGA
jgi:hypothetical protein